MMDVEVSHKPKLCGSGADDGNLLVSYEDFEFEDDNDNDNDDILLSTMLSRIKKKPATPRLVKRLLDNSNSNSLHISVKKSKVSPYDDRHKDEDDIRLSDIIKRPGKSTDKPFSSLKKDIASLEKSFEKFKRKKQVGEKRLQSIQRDIEECSRELENKKNQVKELVSKQNHFECRMKQLESKEKQHEGRVKEHEAKEREFEGLLKDLESKKKHFESQVEELKSKERQLKGQVMELQSKKKQFDGRVKEFESIENEFEGRVKELQSEKNHFKSQVMELESKEEEFKCRAKELESTKKLFESQVEDLKSKEKHFERRWKELEIKENNFKVKVKELTLKEKQFDGQQREPESRTKYIDGEKKSVVFGRTSLQLDTSEKTDRFEPLYSGILVDIRESSDPSRHVLEMIQNPIIPLCKKRDGVVTIADYRIYLLEQLMRISPIIKPCVREEALKLALDMKAKMKENTENSLAVLGFLMLLSIYGLLDSFNEDEVLELFAFVAQNKIAVELFGTLGFANKASDFVEKNLIRKKQFVGAVRFSCAYNLNVKNKLVDMLREHVQNAKLICDSRCEKTNSIEIKGKAKDQEIASLQAVLQCILDCNLQSDDLFDKEIRYRILELKANKDI
ncbi:unnamed protein product [Trifolium pratense]|uniref:Uncharacterized protein n=1 Tax=Trifolium pratense TaxID=57577 RepID=A0ACB0KVU4_TRIPR|nr:unnamed protein product [Trifolium pratense]